MQTASTVLPLRAPPVRDGDREVSQQLVAVMPATSARGPARSNGQQHVEQRLAAARALDRKQPALGNHPRVPRAPAGVPACLKHAMAGNDDNEGIAPQRFRHRVQRARKRSEHDWDGRLILMSMCLVATLLGTPQAATGQESGPLVRGMKLDGPEMQDSLALPFWRALAAAPCASCGSYSTPVTRPDGPTISAMIASALLTGIAAR